MLYDYYVINKISLCGVVCLAPTILEIENCRV